MALEAFKALVELLQVSLELVLPAVGDRQHEHGEVIEHRNQLIPVQPTRHPLAHLQGLRLVALRQAKVVEQAEQRLFNVRGNLAIGRLDRVGQRIGAVLTEGFLEGQRCGFGCRLVGLFRLLGGFGFNWQRRFGRCRCNLGIVGLLGLQCLRSGFGCSLLLDDSGLLRLLDRRLHRA